MTASLLFSRSPHSNMGSHTLGLRLLRGPPSTRVYDLYLGRNWRELVLGIEVPEYLWMSSWRALCIVYDLSVNSSASRA